MNAAVRRWAIVPAAGRGQRFGSRTPKQYTPLLGRPMLSWALQALLVDRSIDGIVVALAPGDRRWRTIPEAKDARVRSCLGGAQREASVRNGLEALRDRARDSDWVLVHDAARPCLRKSDLQALVREIGDDPVGGLLAVPASDTLKVSDEAGRAVRTVPRDLLWRALTPQMFRYGLLRRALGLCLERDRVVTDEASAIEAIGLRPRLVRGRNDNIKVTSAEDATLAALLLGLGVER
jgi:2-C-methyl-D-erythritol 4-phosphate cytidylyltransferase